MGSSDFPSSVPRVLRFLHPAVTCVALTCSFSTARSAAPPSQGFLTGGPTGFTQETRDLPGSWRTSRVQPAPLFDPGGTCTLRPYGVPVLRPLNGTTDAPTTIAFRGSITRQLHSLCTLRSAGRPVATQHSVPGVATFPGQRSIRCKVRPRGFSFDHPPLPGLAWRTPICNEPCLWACNATPPGGSPLSSRRSIEQGRRRRAGPRNEVQREGEGDVKSDACGPGMSLLDVCYNTTLELTPTAR